MHIRSFEPADADAVIALWERCGLTRPWNDPRKDIARKLRVQPELLLIGEDGGRVIASVMAGYDGHRGWLNYLAVEPDVRRRGCGRAIVLAAQARLLEFGCPKINLQIRSTNAEVVAFYRALGFVEDDVLSMGKRLEHDERADSGEE